MTPLILSINAKKRICSDHHVCILMGWALFWIAPWVVFSVNKCIRGVSYPDLYFEPWSVDLVGRMEKSEYFVRKRFWIDSKNVRRDNSFFE